MARYKTYQFDWGFMTIDTQTEDVPEGFTAEFDNTAKEAQIIENGAIIEVTDDGLFITPDEREAP